jgi:hypothetical protein
MQVRPSSTFPALALAVWILCHGQQAGSNRPRSPRNRFGDTAAPWSAATGWSVATMPVAASGGGLSGWVSFLSAMIGGGVVGSLISTYVTASREERAARAKVLACVFAVESTRWRMWTLPNSVRRCRSWRLRRSWQGLPVGSSSCTGTWRRSPTTPPPLTPWSQVGMAASAPTIPRCWSSPFQVIAALR